MEQTPGIGGDGLEIPPLGLSVERAKRQGRLSRTRDAGEDNQGIARNIDVNVLQVVFTCAANANEIRQGVIRLRIPIQSVKVEAGG